jgi:hypothetical protein
MSLPRLTEASVCAYLFENQTSWLGQTSPSDPRLSPFTSFRFEIPDEKEVNASVVKLNGITFNGFR